MIEALKKPQVLTRNELAERLRANVLTARPIVASALQKFGRSGFYLGVSRGKDVLNYKVKIDDTLNSIWEAAVVFAGQNGLTITPGQTAADLVSRTDKTELRFGQVVSLYLDKIEGPIAAARGEIRKLLTHDFDKFGFSHHLLAGTKVTPFECLARSFSDLGIVREDLNGLDWTNRNAAIRSIRRRVFSNSPELANEVLLAEKTIAARQPLTPDILTRLNDTRLQILALLHDDNLRAWHLSSLTGTTVFRSKRDAIERTFPFVKDPCFDPWEPQLRHIRGKVFENHYDGTFLSELFRQLTSPEYASVSSEDIARARQLLSFEYLKDIEALGVSRHLCDTLRPKPTLPELFARAFAVFNLDPALQAPSADHQPLVIQPTDELSASERRLIDKIIENIARRHPQGRSLVGVFGKLSHKEPLLESERTKALKLLQTVQIADLRKWGVKLPGWITQSKMQVGELLILAFPDLEKSQKSRTPELAAPPAAPLATDWSTGESAARIIRGRCFDLDPGLREEVAAMERILATHGEHVASGRLARLERCLTALVPMASLDAGRTVTAALAFPMLDLPVFKEIAARRAEFISTFPEQYAILIPSLKRKSVGVEIAPELYDRLFDDLVLDREQTIATLNNELLELWQHRKAKLTIDQVQWGSGLVLKHSIYLFDALFGLSCEEYLKSAQFAQLLPSKKR